MKMMNFNSLQRVIIVLVVVVVCIYSHHGLVLTVRSNASDEQAASANKISLPTLPRKLPPSESQTSQKQNQTGQKKLFPCSRAHSKFVREYFIRELLPIFQKHKVPVSQECPFTPLNDVYHAHENNKSRMEANKWKCEICGKIFVSETYLDKHFDLKHNSSLTLHSKSVCLANYCRIFRCEALMKVSGAERSAIAEKLLSSAISSSPAKCYDSIMETLKTKCHTFVDVCIPKNVNYHVRNKIISELREALCSYLRCSKLQEMPSFMVKGPSFFKIFILIMCIVLAIIAYAVINHTDLVFDENEIAATRMEENELQTEDSSESLSLSSVSQAAAATMTPNSLELERARLARIQNNRSVDLLKNAAHNENNSSGNILRQRILTTTASTAATAKK